MSGRTAIHANANKTAARRVQPPSSSHASLPPEKDEQFEREADRAADAVAARRNTPAFSFANQPVVQREGAPPKEKSNEEKYKEAANKLGEAFLETAPGKEIVEKAKDAGEAFIATLPGKIITGTALAGAVAGLAAAHKDLPVGIPDIPLDRVHKGLKMKITYEGPVDAPTKVMVGFSLPLGGDGGDQRDRKPMSAADKRRAATMRMQKEMRDFQEGLKTDEQRAEDQRLLDAYVASRMRALTPVSPLSFGMAGRQSGIKPDGPATSGQRSDGLHPSPDALKLTGEQPKPADADAEAKEKKDEGAVQRKAANHSTGTAVTSAPPIVGEVLSSHGRPLDADTRALMESRFGYSFAHVRVHADVQAAESARAVEASAYTVGDDVVFASGQYSPSTAEGQRLIAHELAHVVQQGGASGRGDFTNAPVRVMRKKDGGQKTDPDPLQAALNGDDDAVRALTQHSKWGGITLTAEQAATLIVSLLDGATLDDDEQAGLRILRKVLKQTLLDESLQSLEARHRFRQLLDDYHGSEYRELLVLLRQNIANRTVKAFFLDAFIAMWWVREHEEEAIVVVLERTTADDQVKLLNEKSRIGELRDAIDTERLSKRYETVVAGVNEKRGAALKIELSAIFTIDTKAAVTKGLRTHEEVDDLLRRAARDLFLELALYKRKLTTAVNNPKGDSDDIAKINKDFEKRLAKLLEQKKAEFGLELKYNIEFNRLLSKASGRAWTKEELTEGKGIDEILAQIPPDILHANPDLRALGRSDEDPNETGLLGQATKGAGRIDLYKSLTLDSTAHEIGHFIHYSDDRLYADFQALSGWQLWTVADFTKNIADEKDRKKLLKQLDDNWKTAKGDNSYLGDTHTLGDQVFRIARYNGEGHYYRLKKGSKFISSYAATDPADDFAETFAAYITDPRNLQKEIPDKYKFMHVRVFAEYRLNRQKDRVLKTFDAEVRDKLVFKDATVGIAIRDTYTQPMRAELEAALDKQRAEQTAAAEKSVSEKPKPIPRNAAGDDLAKPYLAKLRMLIALVQPMLTRVDRWKFKVTSVSFNITDPNLEATYDTLTSSLSERLRGDMLALLDPLAKQILAGQNVVKSPWPEMDAIANRYDKAIDVIEPYLPFYFKSTTVEPEFFGLAIQMLRARPAGPKREKLRLFLLDRRDKLLKPEVAAWQKMVVDRLMQGTAFDKKQVETPADILARHKRAAQQFARTGKVSRQAKNVAMPQADDKMHDAARAGVRSPGQPLDSEARAMMEPRFGQDFGDVRVHTDGQAAESAQALDARAYTVGDDIVFDEGEYAPATRESQGLLAHELTHVAQQSGAPVAMPSGGTNDAEPNIALTFEQVDLPETKGDEGASSGAAAPKQPPEQPPASAPSAELTAAASRDATTPSPLVVPPSHPSEQEAERAAEAILASRDVARPQHVANGRVQRAPAPPKMPAAQKPAGKDLVFIMGKDRNKKNPFYSEATKFFKANQPGATLVNDDKHRSLESVFDYLRANPERVANLYLVSHANEDGTLSFPVRQGDKNRKTTFGDLSGVMKNSPELFKLPKDVIDESTVIHIKGCNIGRSTRMLDALDKAFGSEGKVTAPTHKQVYGTKTEGKGKDKHTVNYEALDVYYIEYKGSITIPRAEQLTSFQDKYTHLSKERWGKLIPKSGTTRNVVSIAYTYTYNVKVKNKDTKEDAKAEALPKAVQWGEENIGRPEMFQWRIQAANATGDGWAVTAVAEKTNYTVDKIIADEPGQRLHPPETDKLYYGASTFGDDAKKAAQQGAGAAPGDGTSELINELMTIDRELADPLQAGDAGHDAKASRKSEIEQMLKQRSAFVDVHVVKTEDWLGADEVYVKVKDYTSKVKKLNDNQRFTFAVPLISLMPLREPVPLEVFDEDWPDRDDLIVKMLWRPPYAPLDNTESFDEADYRVTARV